MRRPSPPGVRRSRRCGPKSRRERRPASAVRRPRDVAFQVRSHPVDGADETACAHRDSEDGSRLLGIALVGGVAGSQMKRIFPRQIAGEARPTVSRSSLPVGGAVRNSFLSANDGGAARRRATPHGVALRQRDDDFIVWAAVGGCGVTQAGVVGGDTDRSMSGYGRTSPAPECRPGNPRPEAEPCQKRRLSTPATLKISEKGEEVPLLAKPVDINATKQFHEFRLINACTELKPRQPRC